jgi:polysaccharide pyruvyl transferase WcaK-like protein
VSYRLHASLPAISYGTPTLNFVYDERAKSLFNDLGLTDHYINIVEAGDNLKSIVSQKLSLGPQSNIIDVEKLDWQNKIQAQKNAMVEFKSLIDLYLQKN